MKLKWCLIIIFSCIFFDAVAKIVKPVKWTAKVVYLEENQIEIEFRAKIDLGYHLYSLHPYQGELKYPIPGLNIVFKTNSEYYKLIGTPTESSPIKYFEELNGVYLSCFEKTAVFKQKIQLFNNKTFALKCNIKGNCCESKTIDAQCFGADSTFVFKFLSTDTKATLLSDTILVEENLLPPNSTTNKFRYWIPTIRQNQEELITRAGIRSVNSDENGGVWQLFLLGFLGGLIALLTPCVFPMVPLTVSFFTGRNTTRKKGVLQACIYGGFILLIYILFSLPFHFLDQINENILNDISTNVYLNVAFFVIFILFALSFFGLFEITLPAGLANKMDRNAEAGGFIGSFFMALTLAIVSFSCTGPILGSLLAGSLAQDGGAMQLTIGMGGFGLGLGVPFTIFALFPGLLKSLPKSGGWLNSVKIVLGFLELALALKFLSQADLVIHWNLLKYEIFLGLWVIIFLGLFLYLIGIIRFQGEKPIGKFSKFRIVFSIVVGGWIIYLSSGFMTNEMGNSYRSLNLLSGLLPPTGYSYAYESTSPPGLTCEHDFNIALERARRENKPLLIDFTGKACVNCRKMVEQVWPKVQGLLQSEFVIVSLYVDEKKELPADLKEVYRTRWSGVEKEIETYGDMWSAFEIETFNSNSQPLYVIIDPMTNGEEELMNEPLAGMVSEEEFRNWLKEGIRLYGLK
jgi:thiol:disulfide interchange protein DsbD